jgi:hypothetical protein
VLTERDITILEWTGRQGAVRTEHVMSRFGMGRTATYRRVAELVDYGLVRRHRVLYNDGGLLTATAEGLRAAGLYQLRPARIVLSQVPHMVMSSTVAAQLEPQLEQQRLLTDREHRAAENAAGQPLGSAILGPGNNGHHKLHRPDFVLTSNSGEQLVAIEIELTLKTRARLERILRGYLRNRNVIAIRYHAPQAVADAVKRAAHATGADGILQVTPPPSPGPFKGRL